MRQVVRYFFKGVRAVVGPVILTADRLTTPRGVSRDPAAQARIDEETRNLVIYQFLTCPFCIKTRRALKRMSLNIELRDALRNEDYRKELLEGGGQIKVPCLRITHEDKTHTWMYESDEIIRYLQQQFATA